MSFSRKRLPASKPAEEGSLPAGIQESERCQGEYQKHWPGPYREEAGRYQPGAG